MKTVEITDRSAALTKALLTVWEGSVRATPLFLPEAEIRRIRGFVPQAIAAVERLTVAADDDGAPVAFMGMENGRPEMLFVSDTARGKGIGRALLRHGIRAHGVREVTVNEQDPQAVGFYAHMGFAVTGRTERGRQGGPYPLPIMALR